MRMAAGVERFAVDVAEQVLDDLRGRLRATRWPDADPEDSWARGTERGYLRALLAYWADEFDWRAQERWLNSFDHYRTDVDGTPVHFVRQRAANGRGVPLILTHGWPSCFVEYLPLVPLLTDPAAYGIDGPAFDVVVPSLPGYGFSPRPSGMGVTTRATAERWHRLMRRLGYERYGAGGGDFGAAVATFMALDDPQPLLGLHLSNLELRPYTGPGSRPLTDAETAYLAQNERWAEADRGYGVIQATRPQTVGYGLNDSPAGLAAWIVEKWRSWSDSGGDVEARFSRDFLLTVVTLYWSTQTITSSMRDYVDNRFVDQTLGPHDVVETPTGVAVFANQYLDDGAPPREWAERLYNVTHWTPVPRGGHFAPAEEPRLLAQDLASFFADILSRD
jgi:pimeloyl-ACP methyl ester carboxylesterase